MQEEVLEDPLQALRQRELMQDEGLSDSSLDSLQELDVLNVKDEEVSNVDKFKTVSEVAAQKLIK